jgi:Tol biopolymer transport system component
MNAILNARAQCLALLAGLTGLMPFGVQADVLFGRLVPGASVQANGASWAVDVSADGATVVFSSDANNWVSGDTYIGNRAVAVDLDTGVIEIVSTTAGGVALRGEHPVASGDGRYIAFLSHNSVLGSNWQVGRKDRQTGVLALVSSTLIGMVADPGTDDDTVSISADGRYVAFMSSAVNLGAAGQNEIFVKDMLSGELKIASRKNDGSVSAGNCTLHHHALSGNGRYVVFACGPEMIAGAGYGQLYVRDMQNNTIELASRIGANGAGSTASVNRRAVSPNGRFVSFQNAGYGGLGYANGSSIDGNSGLYLRDRQTQTTTAIARPPLMPSTEYDRCDVSAVSDAGSVLMACNRAWTGVSAYAQAFLFVPGAGAPELVSSTSGGQPSNKAAGTTLAVNASGLSMAFEASASDLVTGDTNNASDIFLLVDESVLVGSLFSDGFETGLPRPAGRPRLQSAVLQPAK